MLFTTTRRHIQATLSLIELESIHSIVIGVKFYKFVNEFCVYCPAGEYFMLLYKQGSVNASAHERIRKKHMGMPRSRFSHDALHAYECFNLVLLCDGRHSMTKICVISDYLVLQGICSLLVLYLMKHLFLFRL